MGEMSENFEVLQAEVEGWCFWISAVVFLVVILKEQTTKELLKYFLGQMNSYSFK